MDNAEAKRLWRERNSRASKAVPVAIPGVGTVYVRVLKVADRNAIERIGSSTSDDPYGPLMAGLLCNEDGSRLPPEEVVEWADIFSDATWADYTALVNAASGAVRGN